MTGAFELGYKDSNLEMTESESVALPFGDSPITTARGIVACAFPECKHFFKFFHQIFLLPGLTNAVRHVMMNSVS